MTKTFPRAIFAEAIERAELFDSDIRDDYSGRGMYGDACFGVVIDSHRDSNRLFLVLGELCLSPSGAGNTDEDLGDKVWELAGAAREDSMGLGTILYFPGWRFDVLACGCPLQVVVDEGHQSGCEERDSDDS